MLNFKKRGIVDQMMVKMEEDIHVVAKIIIMN